MAYSRVLRNSQPIHANMFVAYFHEINVKMEIYRMFYSLKRLLEGLRTLTTTAMKIPKFQIFTSISMNIFLLNLRGRIDSAIEGKVPDCL